MEATRWRPVVCPAFFKLKKNWTASVRCALGAPCLLVLFLVLAALSASAQSAASAVLDRPVVETGDTFSLRVLVGGTQVEPKKVDFAAWHAASFPPENVLSRSAWSRSGSRWVQQFTLIAFDSATLRLPPLTVRLHLSDSALTNPLELIVRPTPARADLSAADPIRPILREPPHWTDYWLEALSVALFAALVLWYFRRKKTSPMPMPAREGLRPETPPETPLHEQILGQLAILEQQKLWKQGRAVQFYAELSLLVRSYLERRFGVPALESTTREILPMLPKTDFPAALSEALRHLLHEADMAKYADRLPPDQACENAIAAARRLVLATAG
jgi:hypothetical protein